MKPIKRLAALLFLAALTFVPAAALVTGCRPKPDAPPVTAGRVVTCGTEAVAARAVEVLPGVNLCLAGTSDITTCLAGLVRPALDITWDTVACVTRHEGAASATVAREDPSNTADARRAARAREFIAKNDIRFTD